MTETANRVSTFFVRAIVDVVERAGVEREALFPNAAERLEDIARGFSFDELAALEVRAMDLTKDDGLGLRIAEQTSEAAFDMVAHLASHAATLRDAISLCTQFQSLLLDGTSLVLSEQVDSAKLVLQFPRANVRADRMFAELAIGGLVRMIRVFGGEVTRVSFEHHRPSSEVRFFGGVDTYGEDATSIELDRVMLDKKQLHHNPELFSLLHAQAESKLERVASFADKVRQHLLMATQIPEASDVATALHVSERSLRRKLADEGVSFKDLRDGVLVARAEQMLSDPNRSIQETAHALGFSDPAAFQRAFKRWKGVTPGAFRTSKLR